MTHVKQSIAKKCISIVCIITMFFLLLPPSLKADQAHGITVAPNVQATLFDAQLSATETGQIARFTIQINNQSNNSVNLIDYWGRIKGNNGKRYTTKMSKTDLEKSTISSNSVGYITFYAEVDKQATLNQLSFDLIEWDFSNSDYESVIGSFKPSNSGSITYGQTQMSVYKDKKVKFNLKNVMHSDDVKYSNVTMEISVTNSSNSTLLIDDLQYQFVTANKQIYIAHSNIKQISLKPYETKSIFVGTAIAKDNWNKQALLQILMTESETITLPIANITAQNVKTTPALDVDKAKEYQISDSKFTIKMGSSSISLQESKSFMTTSVTYENLNTLEMKLPNITYYVLTKDGLMYPLKVEQGEETVLLPKIEQTFSITGQVPSDIKIDNSQIVYFLSTSEEANDSTNQVFIGKSKLSTESGSDKEVELGSRETSYNGFKIEQVSMQRTPSGLNDLIVAEFTVTNNSTTSKPVMQLGGSFVLDKVSLADDKTSVVSLDNLLLVAPNQTYRIIAYGEVPYTQNVQNYGFSLHETVNSAKKHIHSFSVDNLYSAKLLAANESYEIKTVGKRGTVDFIKSNIYEGNTTNLLYTELLYENGERRSNNVTNLSGYVKNAKGDIVDITFESYEMPILPSEQIILGSSAILPRNYSLEGLEIYFGEAINISEEATALVNAVYTDDVTTSIEPQYNFINIPIQQYYLSLKDIGAYIKSSDGWKGDTIELDFTYDLVINEKAPNFNTDHSVIVEFDDLTTSRVKFSKEFKLGEIENSDDSLIIGRSLQKSFEYTNNVITTKTFGTYQLNVYDVYKGHKRLIATRTLDMGRINP